MVEAVASIVGIATFGMQIGEQLDKLRQLYGLFRTAPEESTTLLRDCERLGKLLNHNAAQSRFTGSVKALLRQDAVTKQEARLNNVRDDLSLALQSLNMTLAHTLDQAALLSAVHSLVQQQIAFVDQPPPYQKSIEPSIPGVVCPDGRIVRTCKKRADEQRTFSGLGFQSLWLRKAWHFETLRSYGSWTFSLRSWNSLDPDASVFEIVRQEHLLELQKRLSYGFVSMHDRDRTGKTLFRLTLRDAFITSERQNDYKTIFKTGVTCYWWASILRSHVKPDYLPAFSLLLWSLEDNLLMFGDDVNPSEYVTWLTGCGAAFLTSWRTQFSEARIWMERPGLEPFVEDLKAALRLWLYTLHNSDADLEDYDQKEQGYLQTHRRWSIKLRTEKGEFPEHYFIIRLVAFTFGPQPENWRFYFTTSTDEINHTLSLERIIQRKKRHNSFDPSLEMPGARIDA
ncbi:hypothetical protein LTR24_004228 [Lithohypha guttulata]|uniref:Fungal N-terminal domain-containing protein n=1 Tax=Lithohypha guttulata TaxID=1690604 RepID=A0ABR0KCZ4_9EURO|nr:hypothetical protein LTR24_004228 [Lithohypha guttulata]